VLARLPWVGTRLALRNVTRFAGASPASDPSDISQCPRFRPRASLPHESARPRDAAVAGPPGDWLRAADVQEAP
jgi:hypothetical protein